MDSNKSTFPLKLDTNLCTCCGLCSESCVYEAINMDEYPVIDTNACRLCSSCIQICPSGALSIENTAKGGKDLLSVSKEIMVLAEETHGRIASVTLELLGIANKLATKSGYHVSALLIGYRLDEMGKELIDHGAGIVHLIDRRELAAFIEDNYAKVASDIIRSINPDILLVGATSKGRGLSARIASILGTGLTADCTELDIDIETGLLHQIRPAFGGNLMATIITPEHRPQMASVRPGVMKALEAGNVRNGETIHHEDYVYTPDNRISIVNEEYDNCNNADLNRSRIIIGIGRGIKDKNTVSKIEEWASSIGAAVAGSRAAVEAKLIDASRQIGQTGHTISPDLYIAIGISGQIQHTAAITGAKKIIAINPDKNAPIFKIADYGWIARIEDILPRIMKAYEKD